MRVILFLVLSYLMIFNIEIHSQKSILMPEEEQKKIIQSGGIITEISNNVFKIETVAGNKRILNFNKQKQQKNAIYVKDTTLINVLNIDTLNYAGKFKYWRQIIIVNSDFKPLYVEDLNENGLPEFYGFTGINPNNGRYGPVKVIEMNKEGILNTLFIYDDNTILVKAMGDIHNTGGKDIYLHTIPEYTHSGVVYRCENQGTIPNIFDFIFYYYVPNFGYQINDLTFGDFDGNGITDCVFNIWMVARGFTIAEYRNDINNFQTVFSIDTTSYVNLAGFAIADFDEDGRMEIIFCYEGSDYYVIEANSENNYELIFAGDLPLYFARLFAVTNDLDGNGKKEFWIASVDYLYEYNTKILGFESTGDNIYKAVALIQIDELSTSLGTTYLQANDLDRDNKEELILNVGNHLLILKFSGSTNHHRYSIFYYKYAEATQTGTDIYPSSFYDLDDDGFKDIVFQMHTSNPENYLIAYLLRQNTTVTEAEQESKHLFSTLHQNYPNPFNPSTSIQYAVSNRQFVSLKVYDVLGNEIATLVNEEKPAGSYEVEFDGIGLPSGVYFYRLTAGKFADTKKLILLK